MDYIIILLIIFIIILLVIKTTTNNLSTPSVTKFQPTLIQPSDNSNNSVTYKLVNGVKTPITSNSNNSVTYKLVNGIKTPIISDVSNNSVTYKLVNGVKIPIITNNSNNSVTYKLVNGVKIPIITNVSSGNTENKSGKNITARQKSRYNKATLSDSSTGSTYSNRNDSSASTSISSTPSTSSNKTKNINEVYNISLGASENSTNSCISKGNEGNDSIIHKDKDYYFLGDPRQTQVYHIYNNIYTLKEAQEECSKRTSTLATSEQLETAYSNGADWCSWGWANDGNAYLPNKNKKCNSKIGLLNGKKIDPFLRMGTNCYGVPK